MGEAGRQAGRQGTMEGIAAIKGPLGDGGSAVLCCTLAIRSLSLSPRTNGRLQLGIPP